MKLNVPLYKRINYPKTPVPFEQYLPLKLKNNVSGKSNTSNNVSCMQEIFVLFGCLKKNEFASDLCSEEITKLKKCYDIHLIETKKRNELRRSGIPEPGSKNLNHMQLNSILKKFPT